MLIPGRRGSRETPLPSWNSPETPGSGVSLSTENELDRNSRLARYIGEATALLWDPPSAITWQERAQGMWNIGRLTCDQGLVVALGTHLWAANVALARFADESKLPSRAAALISAIRNGQEVAAFAMTEEGAGSNTAAIRTAACGTANLTLTGRKSYISNVGAAHGALVFAVDEAGDGDSSFSCHLVDLSDPTVTITPRPLPRALPNCPLGDITFSGTPSLARIGRPGQGQFIFNLAMEFERTYIFAGLLGVADGLLCDAAAELNLARQRHPALNGFASGPSQMARLCARSMACWELVSSIAAGHDARQQRYYQASAAKSLISGLLLDCAGLLSRLQGARGAVDPRTQQHLLDGHAAATYSGTTDVQHTIIARGMGIRNPK